MELLEAVHRFRNALISTIETESHKVFKMNGWSELNSFPHGSCDIASNFLGQFLQDQGFAVSVITCNGASGDIPGVTSHVWLEAEEQYIDITGYQFPICKDRIICVRKTEPTWLKEFFQSCEEDGDATSSDVNINSGFGNRSDLYRYIARRAMEGLCD